MTVECAGDTEFSLDAHDSPLHAIERTGCSTNLAFNPPGAAVDNASGESRRDASMRHGGKSMTRPTLAQAQTWQPDSLRPAADAWDAAAADAHREVDIGVRGA